MDVVQFVSAMRGQRKKYSKDDEIRNAVLDHYKPLLNSDKISKAIRLCLKDMDEKYRAWEKTFTLDMLKSLYEPLVLDMHRSGQHQIDVDNLLDIENKLYEHDYALYNGNAQSRRAIYGKHYEAVLNCLCEIHAKGKFLQQVKMESNGYVKIMDFVVGTDTMFDAKSKKLLYVTVKQSVRERSSQVLDEKVFLGDEKLFFLTNNRGHALSKPALDKLKLENIVVVTDKHLIETIYVPKNLADNVISYEQFFLDIVPTVL